MLKAIRGGTDNPGLLVLAVLLGFFEGVDLISIGLTLPRISRELALDPSEAGLCASASILGLALAAVAGGRLADRYGRRPILSLSVLLLGVFSVATTLAPSFEQLLATRFLAGLGMGGVFPLMIAMAGEAAKQHFQARAISMVTACGPLGAVVVGIVALQDDWRWVFYVGGLGPLLLVPLIATIGTEKRANAKMKPRGTATISLGWALFGEGRVSGTLLAWSVSFLGGMVSNIFLNWLPALLILRGLSEPESRVTLVLNTAGSILGSLLGGYMLDRGWWSRAYILGWGGIMASVLALALLDSAPLMFAFVFVNGLCVLLVSVANYALTSWLYPEGVRATGMGVAVATGRIGAVLGPATVGMFLFHGLNADHVLLSILPVTAIALGLGMFFARRVKKRSVGAQY